MDAILRQQLTGGGVTIGSGNQTFENSARIALEEEVANAQTDKLIAFALDVSACNAFGIVSDQDVTVETNSGGSPTNTLTLVANKPYIWVNGSYDTFKLTADVTALYITNASGAAARIKVLALYDSTP